MPQKLYKTLCGAKMLHYVLPIVMGYLVTGTIAQKYIGLYQATQIYFSAPIIWLGWFPLPGMPVFLGLILINITFKILFKSPWNIQTSGIILTHIGMMMLLLGGLFTALFSSEGYVALKKGDVINIVSDYHIREFVVLDGNHKAIESFNSDDIEKGQVIKFDDLGFSIEIITSCKNCKISARENKTPNHKGMAKHMQLSSIELKNNDEENMAGVIFQIKHKDNQNIFVVLEEVQKYPLITIDGKNYKFALRKAQRQLPFSIELLDFEKETYASSAMAKSYKSTVLIKDGGAQWESIISMNSPLRYKGYTFFQSSFSKTEQGDMSVLAAVWNAGRSFPYIAGTTMCIGLLIHIFLRLRRSKNKLAAIVFVLFLGMGQGAQAQDFPMKEGSIKLETKYFAQIPILHEGRIKPLDSFARLQLKALSNKDKDAASWLVEVIFDPARAEMRNVLKVSNPEIITLLNLEKRKAKLYSYKEISKALSTKQDVILSIIETDEKDWTPQQFEFVKLQENMVKLQNLLSSLTMFIPLSAKLPDGIPESLKPYSGKQLTYFDAVSFKDELNTELKNVIALKGYKIDEYTKEEQAFAHLSFSLRLLEDSSLKSTELKVIPVGNKNWSSPWQIISIDSSKISKHWKELSFAYHNEDIALWNKTAKELSGLSHINVRSDALSAEYYYNSYNPFYISFILCLFIVLILVASVFKDNKVFKKLSVLLLSATLFCQIIGMAMRIYILERPPVSTIYETIIFVSLITTLYALMAYLKDRKILWLWLGAGLGIVLGILGFSHSSDGDSFVMLSAVLNTNFWLTTHVLCITAAYGFCALTSVLAHYALLQRILGNKDNVLFKNILTASLFALFLSAIGTVLGGVWADQSWGRFWGWDPKENGALLIVLWLVWAVHGRVSGQMNNVIVLGVLSYLSVILGLSWFGVNLLGVGLHAYGFTNSTLWALGTFTVAETILIISAVLFINRKAINA